MATVFDRPCILKPQDFDVRPLVPGDFATPDRKNVIFMAYCKLGLIRHQTQALQAKSSQDLQQEVSSQRGHTVQHPGRTLLDSRPIRLVSSS